MSDSHNEAGEANEANKWNETIINESHANGGKVGGYFEGVTLLLLTATGARTGRRHTRPLVYRMDGERVLVFATRFGRLTNPDWYHNLTTNPRVTVELGTETYEADAVILEEEERHRLYTHQAEQVAQFAEYQVKTTRKIPVIELVRVS